MTESGSTPFSAGPRALSLAERCAHAFTGRSIKLGQWYFENGQIAVKSREGTLVLATAQGTRKRPYVVGVDFKEMWTRDRLAAGCSCPYAFEGNFCKHIFATLIAIDESDLDTGGAAASCSRLDLVRTKEDLAARAEAWFGGDDGAEDGSREDEEDARRLLEPVLPSRVPTEQLRHLPELARRGGLSGEAVRFGGRPIEPRPEWQQKLESLKRSASYSPIVSAASPGGARLDAIEIHYLLDVDRSSSEGALVIDYFQRPLKKSGRLGKLKPLALAPIHAEQAPDPKDRSLLRLLTATPYYFDSLQRRFGPRTVSMKSIIPAGLWDLLVPELCESGRFECRSRSPGHELRAFRWDDGPSWRFELAIERRRKGQWVLFGRLVRGEEKRDLAEPLLLLPGGLVFFSGQVARLDAERELSWIRFLRDSPQIVFFDGDEERVMTELVSMPGLPKIEIDPTWPLEHRRPQPKPRVRFHEPALRARVLQGELSFEYDDTRFLFGNTAAGKVDRTQRQVMLRDSVGEERLLEQLWQLGAKQRFMSDRIEIEVRQTDFPRVVRELARADWYVEAQGRRIRASRTPILRLGSGQDWFDLEGSIDFDGVRADLPELLRAVRRKETYVRLADGSEGILPEDWLDRFLPLLEMGELKGSSLRFAKNQALLLDVLLAAQENVELDQAFIEARTRLSSLGRIEPRTEPIGFAGQLREYQKYGLGWLHFLQEVGLGGCLADDMGLGKTVQVLALLEGRRETRAAGTPPSLVVAPRSLIHNWILEAARFTPKLHVLDYTGQGRQTTAEELAAHDLVVTTYGTVRRDITWLGSIRFDYVILDEAQAIKNASAQASKACRLLKADHRLGLSGTPIENHIDELWSLFEFLNPRMLGRKKELLRMDGDHGAAPLSLLARAIRPLILRRTKGQVLKELPDKTELTIQCELEGHQLDLYRELREHYRASLTQQIEERGLARSKIRVLEALLRLRQAACHPGLIDERRADEMSPKLSAVLEQLAEVTAEGHKALVFSQFVRFLAIVKGRLDREGVSYAYLDGSTRDRAAPIERFQTDPECKVFLVSLKAGGQGLNLTAADYVFILDPWWNPATEAQAIDRAHRIGQTRAVFAYRLICKDTVEEKILALQATKRKLADAIISQDNSLLDELTLSDLKLLLS